MQFYAVIQEKGIDQLPVAENKAICAEFEYSRERDWGDPKESGRETERVGALGEDGEAFDDEDDPGEWHTPLEGHVAERAIDVVAPLLSGDGAKNVRRRY